MLRLLRWKLPNLQRSANVGRDVDSMIRDLVEASIRLTKQIKLEEKYNIADVIVEDKIIDALVPGSEKKTHRKYRLIHL